VHQIEDFLARFSIDDDEVVHVLDEEALVVQLHRRARVIIASPSKSPFNYRVITSLNSLKENAIFGRDVQRLALEAFYDCLIRENDLLSSANCPWLAGNGQIEVWKVGEARNSHLKTTFPHQPDIDAHLDEVGQRQEDDRAPKVVVENVSLLAKKKLTL